MFRRYGHWLLFLSALILLCIPAMRQPVARMRPDSIESHWDSGAQHYIISDSVRLDINRATLQELTELPEIGATLAQRILEYRSANGAFADISELMEVKGIGDGIFSAIEPYICISR